MVVWLFAEADRIPTPVRQRIDEGELFVSPMVRLELSLLAELGRVRLPAEAVLSTLRSDLDLQVEESGWLRGAEIADHLSWTRDPFDRLIVAHGIAFAAPCAPATGISAITIGPRSGALPEPGLRRRPAIRTSNAPCLPLACLAHACHRDGSCYRSPGGHADGGREDRLVESRLRA